jgi:hypothetical protein
MYVYPLSYIPRIYAESGFSDKPNYVLVSPIYKILTINCQTTTFPTIQVLQKIDIIDDLVFVKLVEELFIFKDTIMKDLLVKDGEQYYLKVGKFATSPTNFCNAEKFNNLLFQTEIGIKPMFQIKSEIKMPVCVNIDSKITIPKLDEDVVNVSVQYKSNKELFNL